MEPQQKRCILSVMRHMIIPKRVTVDMDDLDVWTQSNERALINIVPEKMKNLMLELSQKNPSWVGMGEAELREAAQPNDSMDALRLCFWAEYNRAQDEGKNMNIRNVYSPVMSMGTFYENYLTKPNCIAWMICPPQDYFRSLDSYLNQGKETMGKILKMKIFDAKGRIDVQKAKIFLQAYTLVENRVLGSITQRIQQNTNLHVKAEIQSGQSDDALTKEYEELKAKHASIPIEVKKIIE